RAPAHLDTPMNADLCALPISELQRKLRSKEISPVELTDAYLARVEQLDSRLNTYIRVLPDAAREAARAAESEISQGHWRGPLHGIPFGIKDLFDVAGVPN